MKPQLQLVSLLFPVLLALDTAAVEPAAGLGPTPKWTNSVQLKEVFGKYTLEQLRAEAEHGNMEAQHYLGWLYNIGEGVQTNYAAAAEWYRKAALGGFALAQNNLGILCERGAGVTNDLDEAVRWIRLAVKQGMPGALMNLGRLSLSGKASNLKPEEARVFYEQAAERGDLDAAINAGRCYLYPPGGVIIDSKLAGYWFAYAADRGAVMAYNNLGWLYLDDSFEARDTEEARHWFSKGADQDEPYCELGLAMLELYIHKDSPDLQLMRRWMIKAADKNIPAALFQLGRLSELNNIAHGSDVKPDYTEAAKWYQRAADAGSADAFGRLAELTASGRISVCEPPRCQSNS